MAKSRLLAILVFGLACLFLVACKTTGNPTKSQAADGPQTPPPADSASQSKTASRSGTVKSATATRPKAVTVKSGKAVKAGKAAKVAKTAKVGRAAKVVKTVQASKAVQKLGKLSLAALWHNMDSMRAILYTTLAVIVLAVLGAIAAERIERHRKLTAAPLNAPH